MDIFVHPDNLEAVKKRLNAGEFDGRVDRWSMVPPSFTLRADPHIERTKPSGKFILPSGEVVERHNVVVEDRFVTYGPEDVDWLVMAGVLRHEMTINVVVMKDSPWRLRMWDFPVFTVPRFVTVMRSA